MRGKRLEHARNLASGRGPGQRAGCRDRRAERSGAGRAGGAFPRLRDGRSCV